MIKMLPSSGIRAIFDRAKEIESGGRKVLHLEIGRPDYALPPGALENAKKALDNGFVHYIPNRGLPDLRKEIATDIQARTQNRFDPDNEIIVTTGASEALSMCMLGLLQPGDEVIIPQPAWNHYEATALMAGATPVLMPLSGENGFLIEPEKLLKIITPRTKMLILNTPSNPTGALQPGELLKKIAAMAIKYGFFILSDEVYQDFVYEGEHVSIAKYMPDSELLLYVNSFSKSYAMTGWRIGYIAAKKNISDALNRIHQYLTVCGVAFAQKGAIGILSHLQRQAYLKDLREAFDLRLQAWKKVFLNSRAFELIWPKGAFYLFPRIRYKQMSGKEFCDYMLEEHGIAMVPGEVFGKGFEQHVRISYGCNLEVQALASQKLFEVLNG